MKKGMCGLLIVIIPRRHPPLADRGTEDTAVYPQSAIGRKKTGEERVLAYFPRIIVGIGTFATGIAVAMLQKNIRCLAGR